MGSGSPSWRARCTVRATSSVITADLTAALADDPMVQTPWFCMRTAGERDPRSLATIPWPMESSPISANGPTGMDPPNSSAIAVSTHGIASPRAAQAVAYGLCVCTCPLTSGLCRYTYACAPVSLEGCFRPSTALPSRSRTVIPAQVRSSYSTPLPLITNRSSPGTRSETFPDVQVTSSYRVR